MLSLYYKGYKKVRVSCLNKTGTAEELSRVGSTHKDRPMTIRTGNVRKQLGKDKRGYVCEYVQTKSLEGCDQSHCNFLLQQSRMHNIYSK